MYVIFKLSKSWLFAELKKKIEKQLIALIYIN